MENVNLSASEFWTPDQTSSSYLNYGAAISEVHFMEFGVTWTHIHTSVCVCVCMSVL